MSEQIFNTRIIHKHDIEENWNKAVNFIPKQGELIVYDIDENYNYPRVKIGDGVKVVGELPFASGEKIYKQNEEPESAPDGTLWIDLDEENGNGSGSGSGNKSELVIILEDFENGWGDPVNIIEAINTNRSIRVILDNKTYIYMGYSGNMDEGIVTYFVNSYIDLADQEIVSNSYLYFAIWQDETSTGEIIIESQALKRTTSNPAQFNSYNLLPTTSPVEGGFLRQRNGKPVWELISNAEEASF